MAPPPETGPKGRTDRAVAGCVSRGGMAHGKKQQEVGQDTAFTGIPAAVYGSTSTSATLDAILPLIRPTRREVHLNTFLLGVVGTNRENMSLFSIEHCNHSGFHVETRLS